jgi:YVTN family beta-propeller protein
VILAVAAVVILTPGFYFSRRHVRFMSGNESAGLNCMPCHLYLQQGGLLSRLGERDYLSPLHLAVSPDGTRLYVTAEEADALLVVDATEGTVLRRIAVGRQPHSVALHPNGGTAYVSNRWSNSVSVVDLASGAVVDALNVGAGPAGLAATPDGASLYVANAMSDDISIVDLARGQERRRLSAGRSPQSVGLTPDGESAFITSRYTNGVPHRTTPITEVTVVSAGTERVSRRALLRSAHDIEGIDFTPAGDLAVVTLVRPKNLLPATQVGRGWMLTFGIGVIEPGPGGRVVQLLLDEVNAFFADPFDVVIGAQGRHAFVTHSGADVVSVIDLDAVRELIEATPAERLADFADHLGLSARYVVTRIPTGANPKGLALSPDGRRLYVAERLEDRIAVIDTEALEVVGTIELGGPSPNRIRRGARLFHRADHTFQGQFSCRSCHPEGHHDALTYDLEPDGLGLNVVNNLSLRGLAYTAPYKWTGKNASLYRQCGFRFAKWLTRTEPYTLDELYSLVAYILSLSHGPNRYRPASGELTAAQERGKTLFERERTSEGRPIPSENRCITCHPPPRFTNFQLADVGSGGPLDTQGEFDTPHLDNLYGQAPYLHDGRAATLEEIWTKFGGDDRHGVVNDLTKAQLNDLIEYLKTLGGEPADEERSGR